MPCLRLYNACVLVKESMKSQEFPLGGKRSLQILSVKIYSEPLSGDIELKHQCTLVAAPKQDFCSCNSYLTWYMHWGERITFFPYSFALNQCNLFKGVHYVHCMVVVFWQFVYIQNSAQKQVWLCHHLNLINAQKLESVEDLNILAKWSYFCFIVFFCFIAFLNTCPRQNYHWVFSTT